MSDQLALFHGAPQLGPAAQPPEVAALARRLPEGVRFGTSSWSFPGWRGIVWDREAPPALLAQEGLSTYAKHPLLRAVGVDRTHYAPVPHAQFARWAATVPDGFRFLVKAHEDCTLQRFPSHPRYGVRKDRPNPRFLDPSYATEHVVEPAAALGPKLGALLFQFAAQALDPLGGPEGFADRLHAFLRRLPPGIPYAVEVRNPELITPRYADALLDAGAMHCVNLQGRMPPPWTQARLARCAQQRGLVVRWMLVRGMDYGTAKSAFAPFDRLVAEDPSSRRDVAELIAAAWKEGQQVLTIINNKAEGSAPLSVLRLAEAVVQRLP